MASLRRILLLIAAIVVMADQAVKAWMSQALEFQTIHIMPGLAWELSHNTGAAFGALDGRGMLLIVISLLAVGLILYWSRQVTSPLMAVALGLLLGGATGNLIDRIRLGHVVDFIAFQRGGVTVFPNFNIADSAITVGACLLGWLWFRMEQRHSPGLPPAPEGIQEAPSANEAS